VALYHCLAPSIQTALFNGPLVVLVGWALGKPMDLNFEIFMVVLLVISILVVGNFLRDGESNWLEGALLVVSFMFLSHLVPEFSIPRCSGLLTVMSLITYRLSMSSSPLPAGIIRTQMSRHQTVLTVLTVLTGRRCWSMLP